MLGYRARTVLMCAALALGWHTLQEDRALQRALQVQQSRLGAVTEKLQADLSELRMRQERLSAAAQNITDQYSAAECARRMPLLEQTSVVYTWVNGSDPAYRELRKEHGGAVWPPILAVALAQSSLHTYHIPRCWNA